MITKFNDFINENNNYKNVEMRHIQSKNGYSYYVGLDDNKLYYNIVPIGSEKPNGGYFENPNWICKVKKVENIFSNMKFQIIDNIIDFEDFIDTYSKEISSKIEGESDGWNQKIDAINSILNRENIFITDNIWNNDKTEEIINKI